LLFLAGPILLENALHIVVGVTDTYLANNLYPDRPADTAAAAAAVGSVTYLLWLLSMIGGAVGTGATAIVARAIGARRRREANACAGQAVLLGAAMGLAFGALLAGAGPWLAPMFNLDAEPTRLVGEYLRILGFGVPAVVVLIAANAALRGAGDTITPALAMGAVDLLNAVLSFTLVRGWFGLPEMGFAGLAIGTAIAYGVGGLIAVGVLFLGRSGLKLAWGRLWPRGGMIRRIVNVGAPSGLDSGLHWGANFVVLYFVNALGDVGAAAHNATIRLESFSFMLGFAVAVAGQTMVGQALGRGDVAEARRAAGLAFLLAAGIMSSLGVSFLTVPYFWAGWLTEVPAITEATASALWVCAFSQIGFAAYLVFAGALRGAGDTRAVLVRNVISNFGVRVPGVVLAVHHFGWGLSAVWAVLALELWLRGGLMAWHFWRGRWAEVQV
jgi:putative MATE family efflux protein